MSRTMMPMTLATTSRNESKLNAIGSRTLRRRRYMAASVVQVLAGHRHVEELEPRVDAQVTDEAVRGELEADEGAVGWLAGPHRFLPSRDQVLHALHDRLVCELRVVALPPVLLAAREDRDVIAVAGDRDDEVAVANDADRRRRRLRFCARRARQ